MSSAGPDPRYEWIEVASLGSPEIRLIRGMRKPCEHPSVVDVESVVTGETLARLCLACDTQLSAEWRS